jgi:hypothetical protein
MTIQRMEHVGIVVDDVAAATAFFVELASPAGQGRCRPTNDLRGDRSSGLPVDPVASRTSARDSGGFRT